MIRRPPRSTLDRSSAASDVYKRQGNTLENGDNVVLTQALNVKGTSFSAAKGTIVKKIKLVSDNTEQIEGKINEQTCLLYTSPSPRDRTRSRMPSSA